MIPKPFCFNKSNIKAFVLGADPTNFSESGKRVELDYVFGIGQNPNYFRVLLKNLNEIGLHLEDLYIQNLLPEFQEKETGDNVNYVQDASQNAKTIARELNKIDPSKKIPVFVTAYDVYKAVLNEGAIIYKPVQLYNFETEIPIPVGQNKLDRPLIPLFRHDKYRYEKWPKYKNFVLKLIENK